METAILLNLKKKYIERIQIGGQKYEFQLQIEKRMELST